MAKDYGRAVRMVACIEALKGIVVLLAASGVLALIHHDVEGVAAMLIEHAHLDPAARYPRIFLDWAANVNDRSLLLLAAGAAGYALLRLVEAWGLFYQRGWAEVLSAASGAIYVPFEVERLLRHATWHGALFLVLNLAIVAIMLRALAARRRGRRDDAR